MANLNIPNFFFASEAERLTFKSISRMDVTDDALPRFARHLTAVGYTGSLDVYSAHSVKELIVWLERHWLRALPEEKTLSTGQEKAFFDAVGDEWLHRAFFEYLFSLGAPFDFAADMSDHQRAMAIQWILNLAVNVRYSRLATQHEHSALLDRLEQSNELDKSFPDVTEVYERLGLSQSLFASESDQRVAATALVKSCVDSLRKSKQTPEDNVLQLEEGVKNDLQGSLRLLYCLDSELLQRKVTALLVELQNETCDPLVDASRGKKGR